MLAQDQPLVSLRAFSALLFARYDFLGRCPRLFHCAPLALQTNGTEHRGM